ncbi:MAG: Ig-like domain-containing protein [Sulfurimonadaceae bacterium]
MKHFLVLFLLITASISLYGSNDDLSTSKGTDQEVIVLLSPSVAQTDVWNNAKIEVSFSVPLDASSVQKNNIKLTHLSSKTNDHMDGTIEYDKFDNKVIFTPGALLSEGVYEVEIKSLKADKAYKTTQIKEIKYRFNVPEVINGHQLPPEPDPVVNDSTLLGIDANGNGVRDDVERKIYLEQKKPIDRAVLMQSAAALQAVFIDPVGDAIATEKRITRAGECESYIEFEKKIPLQLNKFHPLGTTDYIEEATINTPERVKAYYQYDKALSGGVYSTSPYWVNDNSICDFNITNVLAE